MARDKNDTLYSNKLFQIYVEKVAKQFQNPNVLLTRVKKINGEIDNTTKTLAPECNTFRRLGFTSGNEEKD